MVIEIVSDMSRFIKPWTATSGLATRKNSAERNASSTHRLLLLIKKLYIQFGGTWKCTMPCSFQRFVNFVSQHSLHAEKRHCNTHYFNWKPQSSFKSCCICYKSPIFLFSKWFATTLAFKWPLLRLYLYWIKSFLIEMRGSDVHFLQS